MFKIRGLRVRKYNWTNGVIIGIFCCIVVICLVSMGSSRQKVYSEVEAASMKPTEVGESFEIWTLEGKMQEVLEETLINYQKEYPNIKFKVKAFKNEIYNEMLLNAARTGSLPDMFYSWGDERMKELVALEVAQDVTSEVKEQLGDKLREGVLESYMIDDCLYGMPAFGWNAVVYCNIELFEANHLETPTTYSELLEVVKAFKEKQITPLMMSGCEAWMPSLYYMELALDEVNTNVVKNLGNHPFYFRRNGFVNAAKRFKELIDLEPWQENFENMSAGDTVYHFTKGEAAMLLSGSWVSTNIEDINHSLIKVKVKVISFPRDGMNNLGNGIAGYSDGFILNKASTLKTVDVKLLFVELMQDISDRAVEKKGMGFPIYKEQTLEKTNFETLKACERVFPKVNYHAAYDKILNAQFVAGYNEALIGFVRGESSITEFIEATATGQDKN